MALPDVGRPALSRGILCAGNTVLDVLVRPFERLAWNTSSWVDSMSMALGGNGANTAYAAALLGARVKLLSWVGQDQFGDAALARLGSSGVDLSQVRRIEAPTPSTVVLVRENGDRMLLHRPGASLEAFPDPLDFADGLRTGAFCFYLGNAFALPHLRRHAAVTLANARAAGLVTAMDTGWDSKGRWLEDLRDALQQTDLLFVNEQEAHMLTGCADYRDAAGTLRNLGAGTVIVKRGAAGCAVIGPSGHFESPGFRIRAVDTTGAGDCFAGGYLAALSRGLEIAEAARLANAVGALCVQQVGATEGLQNWENTLSWLESRPSSEPQVQEPSMP